MTEKTKTKKPQTIELDKEFWDNLVETAVNTKCGCGTCQLVRKMALALAYYQTEKH